MIKRRFYKQEHGDRDEVSDSSSASSDSDSDAEEAQEERDQTEDEVEEEEEEVEVEAVAEAKGDKRQCYSSPDSGYESEDSSGNELDCDSSGLIIDDDEERPDHSRGNLSNSQLPGKGNVGTEEEGQANILAKKDSTEAEFSDFVLKCKSVFKCRICPRIVCLTEDSLMSHLKSKRHARSEKLFGEGRLKLMLNSDGEVEEDLETHAERHARTIALAQESTKKNKKNKGRQRQRFRLKRKKTGNGHDEKGKQSMKNPAKKRRRNVD